jgi:hypothetical protein
VGTGIKRLCPVHTYCIRLRSGVLVRYKYLYVLPLKLVSWTMYVQGSQQQAFLIGRYLGATSPGQVTVHGQIRRTARFADALCFDQRLGGECHICPTEQWQARQVFTDVLLLPGIRHPNERERQLAPVDAVVPATPKSKSLRPKPMGAPESNIVFGLA